jgi:hypothetical protein
VRVSESLDLEAGSAAGKRGERMGPESSKYENLKKLDY